MEFSSCLSLEFAHIHSHSPPLVFLPTGGPLPSSTWSSFRFHGLYVNMSMCIYVHICIYNTYVSTHICLCTCVYVYMCICIHANIYISVYVSHMNEMCSFPSSCHHLFSPSSLQVSFSSASSRFSFLTTGIDAELCSWIPYVGKNTECLFS